MCKQRPFPSKVVQKANCGCDAASGSAHKDGNSIQDPYVQGKSKPSTSTVAARPRGSNSGIHSDKISGFFFFCGVRHFEGCSVQLVERFTGLWKVLVCFFAPCTANRFVVVMKHCHARD